MFFVPRHVVIDEMKLSITMDAILTSSTPNDDLEHTKCFHSHEHANMNEKDNDGTTQESFDGAIDYAQLQT